MFKTYANASAGVSGPGGMGPIQSASAGKTASPAGWSPSTMYMVALVVAEIALVAFITKHL